MIDKEEFRVLVENILKTYSNNSLIVEELYGMYCYLEFKLAEEYEKRTRQSIDRYIQMKKEGKSNIGEILAESNKKREESEQRREK